MTFESYRKLVLAALQDTEKYRHFHGTVRAFEKVGGLDRFAADLLPMLRACYQLKKPITETARRLDTLTELIRMKGVLYVAELEQEKRHDVELQRRGTDADKNRD